jgi:DNA-binding LytR/AlgR family response regulator
MGKTCVIIEDLPVAAAYTLNCCQKSGILEVVNQFSNVPEALAYLNSTPVDLLFLDVEMPGATGFELLDQLCYRPLVILTTSKEEYAYNAFEYDVLDFLKKPFTYRRFQEAIHKLERSSRQEAGTDKPALEGSLFIKTDGKQVRLNHSDILYIESLGDYVRFVTAGKKYISHSTLKSIEEKVNNDVFLKVHRSFIINTSKIDTVRENDLFICGNEIPIGKTHRADVRKRLGIL